MKAVLYPGSFDPLHNGHLSLIHRALKMFDKVIVAIAVNPKKTSVFTVDERKGFILDAVKNDPRVEVDDFQGLLVDYAKRKNVSIMLRGLRAVSDFEFEFQMANMNRKLYPLLETVFVMTGEDHFYVSSNIVREVASLGGDVSGLVPDKVLEGLRKKYAKP